MIHKKFFFISLFLIYFHSSKAQSADDIINNYVGFSGGKEWKKIHSIVTSGKYSYGGMEFSFTSYSKAPDLYKYVVLREGKNYVQSYDGVRGWKMDGFNNDSVPTFLTGKAARAMANEADVEIESPLIDYKRKGYSAIFEGPDTIQNTACYKIKFTRKDGEIENYFFDRVNYALVLKSAVSKNEEMKSETIDTFYSDYRSADGVKIPFKAISRVSGQTILTVIVEKVQVNELLPDKTFQP